MNDKLLATVSRITHHSAVLCLTLLSELL